MNEHNPIEIYASAVLEYLRIENILAGCKTQQDWQKAADMAHCYLEPGFYDDNTDLELFQQIMTEYKNHLLNVTYDLQSKMKNWKIDIQE